MAFRTNRETGVVFKVSEARTRVDRILAGRKFADLPPFEKAQVTFILENLTREQRLAERAQAERAKFERRSMLTESDIRRNLEVIRAREERERVESVKFRPVKTRLKYNEALQRWELVQE